MTTGDPASRERLTSAVRRNLNEVRRARFNWMILVRMENEDAVQPSAPTFFHVVYLALKDDTISHTHRVLDRGKNAASFWYVYRCEQPAIDTICRQKLIDLAPVAEMADRIKIVRDKTHAHIDFDAVKNPRQVWADAGIKPDALMDVLESLEDILSHLWAAQKEPNQQMDDYDASDVEAVIDAARKAQIIPPAR